MSKRRTPKVSVLIPMYNAEPYIEQTLESILHQTMVEDIECLIIDDGSTDKSGEIADIYMRAHPWLFTVVHQECISQANALNRAVRMAKGEYVAECDADDFVSIQMYEKLYNAATDPKYDTTADAVRCGFFGVWDNGYTQPNYLHVPEKYLRVSPIDLKPEEYGVVFGKVVLLPAGIYRRKFILDNHIFWREDGQNYEDTCVSFKIRGKAKDYRFLNEVLYYYRRGNENSGSATIFDDFAICEQYREIERYCGENGLPFMEYMNTRRYYDYMWSLKRTPEERRVDFLMQCMEDFREHPAKRQYFNSTDDWREYCVIKYGAWMECGVKE